VDAHGWFHSRHLKFTLPLGQMTQIVEVNGALRHRLRWKVPTVTGNSQGTGGRELPLNGRAGRHMAKLDPGVESVRSHPQGTQGLTRVGHPDDISGGVPTQNSYSLDGHS